MRICYIADAPSPHVQKWAGHFARDHEVHVLSFRDGAIEGARVHHLGMLSVLGKARYPLQTPRVRQLLRCIDPDIVHALHLTSYGFVAALAGRHPLVTSVWGYDILQAPHHTPLHARITRYALSRADIITATGDALAAATRPYAPPGRPIHVVPYGIDLTQFAPPPPADGPDRRGVVIGSVKALLPEKGFGFLLQAMPSVLARHPDTRLLLVGDGSERPRLERQARQLGLERQVEFAGDVANARVPEYMSRMDVYVQPSLTESFGVSAIEASACELPVVATAVEGGRDVVLEGETGLLVRPADSRSLAEAIVRLLDDPGLRRSMGVAGRRFVTERYNWPENAAQMAALYTEAVEAHRARRR